MPTQFPPSQAPSDPRAARTQASLREAVLRLAGSQRVEDISVSQLTAAAQVNRTTFYRHATSAADVLREALYADFDAIRTDTLAIGDSVQDRREAWMAVTVRIAEHMERFEDVYRTGFGNNEAPSPALMRIAAEHFETSVHQYLERFPSLLPSVPESALPTLELAAARFIASGTVELMRTWIQSPTPRDPRDYATITLAVMPAWFLGGPTD